MNTKHIYSMGAARSKKVDDAVAANKSVIKLGLDIHSASYTVVAQYDHATPKPPRRFAPGEFLPWVKSLLLMGHEVHVVYEACGFGFDLFRALEAAGAHCLVISPQKLDELRLGVKTDGL